MAFSLVYLGEHYVFDVLVGILIAMIAETVIRLIGRIEQRRTARTP
jgi:membrane-associated phospholipid phosphatase